MKISRRDLEAQWETIDSTGEFRLHILYSRSGLTVKARLWHPDGMVVGVADGGGYDRAGSVLGQAIEKLWPQSELKRLILPSHRTASGVPRLGLYGLEENSTTGKRWLHGSCGLGSMLAVLDALGYPARVFSTGNGSQMVLATRRK